MSDNYILEGNLITALCIAVDALEKRRTDEGWGLKSALQQGLEDVLEAHKNGQPIKIRRG
jgi:uncharacterized protein YicC (UPF0701 family)